jgi:hypothetical protein
MGLFKVRIDLVLFLKVRFFCWFMGWFFYRNNEFFPWIGVTCSKHGLF